jgi:hypothetical protein
MSTAIPSAKHFDRQLEKGRAGESLIALWLVRRGFDVLPAYEIENSAYKGPRLFSARGNLVAPDLLAFRLFQGAPDVRWCEAKSKAAFTWHRLSETYQDGIDKHYWVDYLALRDRMPWPLWLLFLHGPGQVAKDNPEDMIPPIGLFGGEVQRLAGCIHHESDKWGKGGMVYWTADDLCHKGCPLASWQEVSDAGVSQVTT